MIRGTNCCCLALGDCDTTSICCARREALTSRPLLLAAVGRTVSHAGQTLLYLTPMHAEVGLIATFQTMASG